MLPGTFLQPGFPPANYLLKSPGNHNRVSSGSIQALPGLVLEIFTPVPLSNTGSAVLDAWNLQKVRAA